MNNQQQAKIQAPINMAAIKKQLETAPFEICRAEPEQQVFKRNVDKWLCLECFEKLSHEPEIKTIRNNFNFGCARCDNIAVHLVSGYETCTSKEFIKTFMFKKLSALVSPTGQEQTIELQVLKCAACGAQKIIKQ